MNDLETHSQTSTNLTPGGMLRTAHEQVTQLVDALRVMAEAGHEQEHTTTSNLRQTARALDELTTQSRFAAEHDLPAAADLAERERTMRAAYIDQERYATAWKRAVKLLDQLIRQIDMSSSTLTGSAEGEASDPWSQALRSQVVLGREEERVRLAREVHDGPAQVLANMLMVAEHSRSLLQDEQVAQLAVMLDRMCDANRNGLREVRQFIANLRPGQLTEQGLVVALSEYTRRYSDTYNVQVLFEADTIPRLPAETEIVLYRVTQEALQNAHKHAPGAPISVTMYVRNVYLILTIRDDGPGFDPREVAQRAGRESWGLTSMRERAELIGARFRVYSQPGQGTEVSIALPLQQP